MRFIGIDPGKSGAIAVIDVALDGNIVYWDVQKFSTIQAAKEIIGEAEDVYACIEQVHSMPREGVKSTFTFAYNCGMWEGLLSGLNIPYMFVTPQKWHTEILSWVPGTRTGMNNKKVLKQLAVTFIKQRFPELASALVKRTDQDKADAMCICIYGYRHPTGHLTDRP